MSTMVGPASRVDGFYAWEPLMEPVRLRPGEEYRLSQRLSWKANMSTVDLQLFSFVVAVARLVRLPTVQGDAEPTCWTAGQTTKPPKRTLFQRMVKDRF